jgi:hypothetical protein
MVGCTADHAVTQQLSLIFCLTQGVQSTSGIGAGAAAAPEIAAGRRTEPAGAVGRPRGGQGLGLGIRVGVRRQRQRRGKAAEPRLKVDGAGGGMELVVDDRAAVTFSNLPTSTSSVRLCSRAVSASISAIRTAMRG